MACTPIPSVTLWGTTQITTTTRVTSTSLSLITRQPATTLTTSAVVSCDVQANCVTSNQVNLITVTPTIISTISVPVDVTTVLTSIVPRQTLYSPCANESLTESESPEANAGASASLIQAQPFSSPVIAASTSSATLSLSAPTNFAGFSVTSTSSLLITSSSFSTYSSPESAASASESIASSLSISSSSTQSNRVIQSSSTASMTSSSAKAVAGANGQSRTVSHRSVVAGSVMGSLIAICIVLFILIFFRRRHVASRHEVSEAGNGDDIWEARFRELEAETNHPAEEGNEVSTESKKLRLTLDLESKALPDRPASRLSTISAFFKPSPQSIRVPAAGGAKLNFSRPLYRLRTASTASYRSKASDHSVTRKVPFIDEERKGMEWIRGEALEIMGQPDKAGVASAMRPETEMITSTSVPHQDPPTTQSSYPAERRKRPLPNGLDRVFPLPDVNIQSNPPNLDSVELDVAGFTVSSISNPPKSRRLFPSEPVSSIRERRESQGRPIPTLHLSREAITPSLWLDDELNAMFSRESQSDGPYGGIDPGSVEIKPRSESRLGRKWVDDEEEEMLVSVCHS